MWGGDVMRAIKLFEEYLEEDVVKKVSPDFQRAEHLENESKRKFHLLKENISKLGVGDENANDYVEYCYNIIIFLIRSKMFKKGYASSGQGAHEAEVAFTRKLGLNDFELELLDQLRYFRNGILYYGKRFDKEYAEKIIDFTKKAYQKLL